MKMGIGVMIGFEVEVRFGRFGRVENRWGLDDGMMKGGDRIDWYGMIGGVKDNRGFEW